MYGYPCQIDSDWGSHFEGHDVQDWTFSFEHDIQWRFHLPYDLKAAGLVERKNEILKQQIKLLTCKTTFAG